MMKGILKLTALLGLLAGLNAQADDKLYFMAVDATGLSLPKAVLHVMTVTGPGEQDFRVQAYPADPNGVFVISRQGLPKTSKGWGWAWCIDEIGHDGVTQNWPDASKLPEHSTVSLKTIQYPHHCSQATKAGFYLLNPKDSPQVLYLNKRDLPSPSLRRHTQVLPEAHS